MPAACVEGLRAGGPVVSALAGRTPSPALIQNIATTTTTAESTAWRFRRASVRVQSGGAVPVARAVAPRSRHPCPDPAVQSPGCFLSPWIPGSCYADAPRQRRLPFLPAFVPPQGDYLGSPGRDKLIGTGCARGSLGLPHAWGVPSVGPYK
ncbi:uncharacterized protein AAEQ78_005339 [Lycaon pictus]